jgi:hypothetical protein
MMKPITKLNKATPRPTPVISVNKKSTALLANLGGQHFCQPNRSNAAQQVQNLRNPVSGSRENLLLRQTPDWKPQAPDGGDKHQLE